MEPNLNVEHFTFPSLVWCAYLVLRKVVQELADFVVVIHLEVEPGPCDAIIERDGTVVHQGLFHVLERVELGTL